MWKVNSGVTGMRCEGEGHLARGRVERLRVRENELKSEYRHPSSHVSAVCLLCMLPHSRLKPDAPESSNIAVYNRPLSPSAGASVLNSRFAGFVFRTESFFECFLIFVVCTYLLDFAECSFVRDIGVFQNFNHGDFWGHESFYRCFFCCPIKFFEGMPEINNFMR
jgi:hypothetical protein